MSFQIRLYSATGKMISFMAHVTCRIKISTTKIDAGVLRSASPYKDNFGETKKNYFNQAQSTLWSGFFARHLKRITRSSQITKEDLHGFLKVSL